MSKQKVTKKTNRRFRQVSKPHIYTEQDIALSKAKVNIHIRLDADIVSYFKDQASQSRARYQSLINQHLRETIFKERNLENRLERIEEHLGIN